MPGIENIIGSQNISQNMQQNMQPNLQQNNNTSQTQTMPMPIQTHNNVVSPGFSQS